MNDKRLILEHGCFEKLKDKSLVVPFVCPVCSCRFDAEYNRRDTSVEHFHGWKRFWYDIYPDHYRYVSKAFVQSVIMNVRLITSRVSHLQSILKRCKMKSYFQKMFPHIKFMIWFGFYYAGLVLILSFIATNIITKLITIALWYCGYPYTEDFFK